MKAAAVAVLCFILAAAAVEGEPGSWQGTFPEWQICHYDCYNVTSAGAAAKQALLQQCGVTDFKVTSSGDLAGTYKKGAAPGCQTAACGRYANQAAIDTYRNSCEHVDSKYQLLSGKGTSYNAPCASCS